MRILLLSDIHSNLEALEACLAAAPPNDLVINLGDIVGYGASPNEVTDRSRAMGTVFVRGNHDKACTGVTSLEFFNPVAALAALWTQQTLTPENHAWLRDLPPGPVPIPGPEAKPKEASTGKNTEDDADKDKSASDTGPLQPVFCVHGSPLDEDEYIISLRDALDILMRSNIRITFFGHTHVQGGFALDKETGGAALKPAYVTTDDAESLDLTLEPQTKYLINPGSVGQPRDGDWRAAFALYETVKSVVTYYRVPYDVKSTQERILKARLPERLATRLTEGR